MGRDFTEFHSKQTLSTMANPIPNIVAHPQFVGTSDSADFQGPIARPVSGDFHHFFARTIFSPFFRTLFFQGKDTFLLF